jgi:hypothetical protein
MLLCALSGAGQAASTAASAGLLYSVRLAPHDDMTRVVLELDRAVACTVRPAANGHGLVLAVAAGRSKAASMTASKAGAVQRLTVVPSQDGLDVVVDSNLALRVVESGRLPGGGAVTHVRLYFDVATGKTQSPANDADPSLKPFRLWMAGGDDATMSFLPAENSWTRLTMPSSMEPGAGSAPSVGGSTVVGGGGLPILATPGTGSVALTRSGSGTGKDLFKFAPPPPAPIAATGETLSYGDAAVGHVIDAVPLVGDRGVSGALEFRYDLASNGAARGAQLFSFFDNATVWTNGIGYTARSSSAGGGVRGSLSDDVAASLTFVQTLNPVPGVDEGKRAARLLFNSSLEF